VSRRDAGPAAGARPRRPAAWRLRAVAGGAGACVAAALALTLGHARHPQPAAATAGADSLEAVSPDTVWARAQRLQAAGRLRESLPYLAWLAAGPGAEMSWVHYEYGRTLYYASFRLDTTAAGVVPAEPTSVGRVAATRAAIAELQVAMQQAPDGRTRAQAMHMLARALQAWGFPWEAWIWHRRAAASDPSQPLYAREADGLLGTMQDPVHARVLYNDAELRAAH